MTNDECLMTKLEASAFFEKRANQLHSLPFSRTGTQLRDAALHPARPVRARSRSRNVEPIFSRKQVGDHYDGNPRFALEKGMHRGWMELALEIDLIAGAFEPRERSDLFQVETRLLRHGPVANDGLLPHCAQRRMIVCRIGRDR